MPGSGFTVAVCDHEMGDERTTLELSAQKKRSKWGFFTVLRSGSREGAKPRNPGSCLRRA
jgi:hypothetical protein